MSIESQLREKLKKIESLFSGATTTGEREAAEAALDRVRSRLAAMEKEDPPIEMRFALPDPWSRQLFLALSRRYGLRPFRYPRQRRSSIMVRLPETFLNQVLWPECAEMERTLRAYLDEITQKVIREEVYGDTSEAPEVAKALSGDL